MLLSRQQSGVNLQGVEIDNILKKLGLAAALLVAGIVPAYGR